MSQEPQLSCVEEWLPKHPIRDSSGYSFSLLRLDWKGNWVLQYVLHFPKGEKYVSLLKKADNEEAQLALDKERSRLRAIVRQQLADEALVADVDEGKSKGLLLTVSIFKNTLACILARHYSMSSVAGSFENFTFTSKQMQLHPPLKKTGYTWDRVLHGYSHLQW